jgi:PAS domain-containing protein
MPALGAAAADALLSEVDRRRKKTVQEIPPHVPLIEVSREGEIQWANRGARRALEYSSGDTISSCFFSHVHEHNLGRVMRELAQLVERKIKRARWLFRLRTGAKRYRWFRAQAESVLYGPTVGVQILLRPL